MEGFLTCGWELVLRSRGGTAALARGANSPRADSRNSSQSAIGQWDWGLLTLWGGIEPGDFLYVPGYLEL